MLLLHLARTCALAALLLLGVLDHAEAGPPLICQPFSTLNTSSLPWKASGDQWNGADPTYSPRNLSVDTMRLLSATTPVLARMETMRRASIYAMRHPGSSYDLLVRVIGRALNAAAEGRADTLAWFDAGYLIESYRQAGILDGWETRPPKFNGQSTLHETIAELNGYAWVRRALESADATPEMELAAALMTQGAVSKAHLSKAALATTDGSALATSIVRADGEARTLGEIRARLASRR
jgi:hypothetical protein